MTKKTASTIRRPTFALAARLRKEALENFSCLEFHAVSEGTHEVALSYWTSLSDIKRWREHAEHIYAQELGLRKWYRSVRVEVTEVIRSYRR